MKRINEGNDPDPYHVPVAVTESLWLSRPHLSVPKIPQFQPFKQEHFVWIHKYESWLKRNYNHKTLNTDTFYLTPSIHNKKKIETLGRDTPPSMDSDCESVL